MPKIPVNPRDLPTEFVILDDTLAYKAIVKELRVSDNPDKNGNLYLIGKYEITEPLQFRGKNITDHYIGMPGPLSTNMDSVERDNALSKAVKLGRLIRSAGFKTSASEFDTDELLGATIEFDIKNQEYQGRTSSKINNYLFSDF